MRDLVQHRHASLKTKSVQLRGPLILHGTAKPKNLAPAQAFLSRTDLKSFCTQGNKSNLYITHRGLRSKTQQSIAGSDKKHNKASRLRHNHSDTFFVFNRDVYSTPPLCGGGCGSFFLIQEFRKSHHDSGSRAFHRPSILRITLWHQNEIGWPY